MALISLTAFAPSSFTPVKKFSKSIDLDEDLKAEALAILETKCNTCHRKQNPFMVFNQKNMVKRAPRIYKAVFVDRRMPKGDKVRLSEEEAVTLKNWLSTQKLK